MVAPCEVTCGAKKTGARRHGCMDAGTSFRFGRFCAPPGRFDARHKRSGARQQPRLLMRARLLPSLLLVVIFALKAGAAEDAEVKCVLWENSLQSLRASPTARPLFGSRGREMCLTDYTGDELVFAMFS